MLIDAERPKGHVYAVQFAAAQSLTTQRSDASIKETGDGWRWMLLLLPPRVVNISFWTFHQEVYLLWFSTFLLPYNQHTHSRRSLTNHLYALATGVSCEAPGSADRTSKNEPDSFWNIIALHGFPFSPNLTARITSNLYRLSASSTIAGGLSRGWHGGYGASLSDAGLQWITEAHGHGGGGGRNRISKRATMMNSSILANIKGKRMPIPSLKKKGCLRRLLIPLSSNGSFFAF